jgi:hypothetical protein
MAGYLDHYGAGEEQRNRLVVRTITSIVAIVVITGLGWYLLKNRHQESVIKTFLSSLRKGDYQTAYREWGCTDQKPCSGYTFQKFMSDWGPQSLNSSGAPDPPDMSVLGLSDSESCNSGVLLTVQLNRGRAEKLWVDKRSDSINFAPYPICPHKSPFAIMIHRTIGQLRKPLLK